jgi:LacI family transcriptional regulator
MRKPTADKSRSSASKKPRKIAFFCDIYTAEIHAGVVDYARTADWALYDGKCYDLENTYSEPVDGILTIVARPRLAEWLLTQNCPVVQMLSLIGWETPVPVVEPDPAAIGVLAAEHFLTLGSPECVFYRTWLPDEREVCWKSFAATLRAAGRSVHLIDFSLGQSFEFISTHTRHERWAWLAEKLRSLPQPIAAFVMDDRYVNDLFQAAKLLEWRIPDELAVLGADNRPLILGKQPISVSSVDTNLHGVGWAGAALLDRILDGEKPPIEPIRITPGHVIERSSTATFVCNHPGVTAAMNYLRSHYQELIQLPEIANSTGLSARSLQKTFKAVVGRSIFDELGRLRVSHAARLLRETNLKLESVAHESGLRNAQYLCGVFRQVFNTTPVAYRDLYQRQCATSYLPVGRSGDS